MMLKENGKRIAFAVHEDKNTELIEWSYFNKNILNGHEIIACGKSAGILEGTLHSLIKTLPEGPLGGFQALNDHIKAGKIDILIFFWNDNSEYLMKPALQNLLSAALEANIVIIHNRVSADCILLSALAKEVEKLTA